MSDEPPASNLAHRLARFAILSAIVLIAAVTMDGLLHSLAPGDYGPWGEWFFMLGAAGYLPTWLIIAGVFALIDRSDAPALGPKGGIGRATYLALTVLAAGVGAELLKLLLRRERPGGAGEYVFRSLWDRPWSTAGLGLPSSHAMIAFAGAFALWRLIPQGRPVWIALAVGCGLTRLLEGDSFLSDVALGALAGYAVAWALWRGLGTGGAKSESVSNGES